jgi:formate-dependent phosphoribosylglycinamide formyltransferase (GAR transformylase)
MQFCEALETGGGVEDAERVYPELLADLYAIRAHMRKLAAQSCAFQAEQQLYAEKQAQLQASIQQVGAPGAWCRALATATAAFGAD